MENKLHKVFVSISVQSVPTPSILIEFVSWHHEELTICFDLHFHQTKKIL